MDHRQIDWHRIVNEIGPPLYRYFCGTFAAPEASDLVQETLLRVVRKQQGGEFSPTKGTLRSYAFGIARFVRLEALKMKPIYDLVDDENSLDIATESQIENLDQIAQLRGAIGKLKPMEQEIVLQLLDSDSSLEQIANSLNLPLGTVKSHVHRAKESLRQHMEVKI